MTKKRCVVCNGGFSFFEAPVDVQLETTIGKVHYECREKSFGNPENYGGKIIQGETPSDGELTSSNTQSKKIGSINNNSPSDENNSSSAAIATLDTIAAAVLFFSMLSGLIIAVLGGQSGIGGGYLVVAGILIAVVGLVQWAFIKVFAGIAEDIKAIREKI
jgi:hypothetical protein